MSDTPFQSPRAVRRFASDTSGTMTIFGLFFVVIFFVVGGMAVDFMRYEDRRVRVQHTLDRAVLAAADLDQGLDATAVVLDYFAKAGIPDAIDASGVTPIVRTNCRDVTAVASLDMPTFFLHMTGIDSLTVPASGRATECVTDVEISLVLDVSSSMNDFSRLTNLKSAAKQFVRDMIPDTTYDAMGNENPSMVSISIVPFSTQVSLGHDLAAHFTNLTSEHGYSDCVRFETSDFDTVAIDEADTLQREGHFNRWDYNMFGYNYDYGFYANMNDYDFECPQPSDRDILAWEASEATLESYIENLYARGNTSIDIGAKWGAALLDPALQEVVADRIGSSKVDGDFAGRPVDYGTSGTLKVLVVMSDGANTSQATLNDDYMGTSPIWVDPWYSGYGDDEYSHQTWWGGSNDWWWHYAKRNWSNPWRTYPDGDAGWYYQMSWHEVFERMSVEAWSRRINEPYRDDHAALADVGPLDGYDDAVTFIGTAQKDTNLTNLCNAAKSAGILVFTVRYEITPDSSEDLLLKSCASGDPYSFDPSGTNITTAFSSIESTINQLRLVE